MKTAWLSKYFFVSLISTSVLWFTFLQRSSKDCCFWVRADLLLLNFPSILWASGMFHPVQDLRQYLSNLAEQCSSEETDTELPTVVILDNLHHIGSLSDIFNGFLNCKYHKWWARKPNWYINVEIMIFPHLSVVSVQPLRYRYHEPGSFYLSKPRAAPQL